VSDQIEANRTYAGNNPDKRRQGHQTHLRSQPMPPDGYDFRPPSQKQFPRRLQKPIGHLA
jgi:hypothetical protein